MGTLARHLERSSSQSFINGRIEKLPIEQKERLPREPFMSGLSDFLTNSVDAAGKVFLGSGNQKHDVCA